MACNIEQQMNKKGYSRVSGMAVINDVAVTKTHREILSPRLATQEAVDIFNNEFGDGWTIYRKTPEKANE